MILTGRQASVVLRRDGVERVQYLTHTDVEAKRRGGR